jgi:hypothetical protein
MTKVDVVSVARQPRLRLNLVALVDIGAREIVFACAPADVTADRTWRTIQIGFARHVKNEWLDYVDHSCTPNAVFDVDGLTMVAIRPIAAGESITFFYPGAEVELAQGFTCGCGAAHCIGELKGGFYLTTEQMRWALEQNYCTRFIREHFARRLGISAPAPAADRASADALQSGR